MMNESPVEVYAALNITEAQFLCDLLADEEIEARVVGEALAMGSGEPLPLFEAPRIWVPSNQVERARRVIEEYERRRAARRAKA